jgi:hypothetical protein
MISLPFIPSSKRQLPPNLLGLTLDGSRMDAVVLRRTNGSIQVQQTASLNLSLDPLTADPELVGQEIRNQLDAAEMRERVCVLGVPLKWALTTHVEIPDMAESEVAGFLQMEAERGFPCDVATLLVATSRWSSPDGKKHATLVGIPRNHLTLLETALRAARLRPISFSLGITALQPAAGDVLALAIGESQIGLQITCGGGVAALRALEGSLETEGAHKILNTEMAVREARISLGQLPAAVRETVRSVRIFGPRDLARQLAGELQQRFSALGLKIQEVEHYSKEDFGVQLPADAPVNPALSLAAAKLARRDSVFEFLPPKVSAFQQISKKYSSGKLRMVGAAAAAAVLLVGCLFAYQSATLAELRSDWKRKERKVAELKGIQEQIRQYRPWFDTSIRALTILRQITAAFPDEASVSAKTIEIRDLNTVVCSGVARDNRSLLAVIDKLRNVQSVSGIRVVRISGKNPLQYTFDFHWSEGGKIEN